MSGCEPGGHPIIVNQRDKDSTIFYEHVRGDGTLDKPTNDGLVPARTTKQIGRIPFLGNNYVIRIEAEDESGTVIFSNDYKLNDLKNANWIITIQP